jgi:MbtH protein
MFSPDTHGPVFLVVVNDEQQFSIWPQDKALPLGWTPVGAPAAKDICLARIEQLWTDMRPLSLRNQMAAAAA